jgi:hypothetical protein
MAPTVSSALSDFITAVTGIFQQLFNSVLAVFQAFFALGKDTVFAFIHLGQSILKLGLDVAGGVLQFVVGMSCHFPPSLAHVCHTRRLKE